nr:sugar kinase [Actinomycetota bacterium]
MRVRCTIGVDIGTSSSKGVLVDADGAILAQATRTHEVSRPRTGWVEMDGGIWWDEFVSLARELRAAVPDAEIAAVGVSGMGPCILLVDAAGEPVRPA